MAGSISQVKNELNDDISKIITTSESISTEVHQITKLFLEGLDVHLNYLSNPNEDNAIGDLIQKVQKFEKDNFKSKFPNNLKAVSEFVSFFSWPFCDGIDPPEYCSTVENAVIFYLNRIRTTYKSSDQNHINWCNQITSISKKLNLFVKNSWPKGFKSSGQAVTAQAPVKAQATSSNPLGDLKSELHKGLDITAGLKKVTDDMKTHKNPQLRGTTNADTSTKSAVASSAAKPKQVSSPIFDLSGNKWQVGFQTNVVNLTIDNCQISHSISMFNCTGTVLSILGKVNTICLNNLKKCGVEIHSAVSIVELANCQDVKIKINNFVPSVNIDKSDSVVVYVSEKEYKSIEFYFSKHSSIAINIFKPDGDAYEIPVLEQSKGILKEKNGSVVLELEYVTP